MLPRTMAKRLFSLLGCGQEVSVPQEGQQPLFSTTRRQKHRRIEKESELIQKLSFKARLLKGPFSLFCGSTKQDALNE